MSDSSLIQSHHRDRKAVIYIRQSSGHQVLTNVESRRMQLAMREHAQRLGWDDGRIEVVEADTGITATSTAGRDAYKNLLTQVAMGQVGIVLSYESARLSRNCTDWYPLLDLCAYNGCLIADCDGVYDPATANGRLLLGMKGILSEVELHTLRGRLIAGVQSKARRGELALALPAGLVRQEDERVVKDPNLQVQHAIELIFRTFLTVRSASKVVRHLRTQGLRIPRRQRNAEMVWREPTAAAVVGILRNPAYAGAFVYGRTRTVRRLEAGDARPRQQRRDQSEWSVIVQNRYPSYIAWETYQQIQATLRDNYAEYDRNKSRGVPREGAALLQGAVYCGECGHKMFVQYKGARVICATFCGSKPKRPSANIFPPTRSIGMSSTPSSKRSRPSKWTSTRRPCRRNRSSNGKLGKLRSESSSACATRSNSLAGSTIGSTRTIASWPASWNGAGKRR